MLRVLGFLEQFQALFAQRLNPSMVALGQRRKGRIHEAYGNIGTVTDLSKQRQALIEQRRRLSGVAMCQSS